MPVIPKEGTGLESIPKAEAGPQQGQEPSKKATVQDFSSHGPQIPNSDSLPPKASREETEAKMKEMNK